MSRRSVQGKVALITGAGSGINFEFARLLLSKGCSVMIGDLSLRPEAQALVDHYSRDNTITTTTTTTSNSDSKESPVVALFHKTDVTSWPQLSSLWSATLAAFDGRCDIVVPGAGIFEPAWSNFWVAPATAETNPASASRDRADAEPGHYALFDVNLVHPVRLSQLAIGYWTTNKQKGGGDLIHLSSIAGHMEALGSPMYVASKHGIHGFVRSLGALRDELGIRVSAIAPGPVRTPMWSEDPLKAGMAKQGAAIPLTPEEVASAMLELHDNPDYGNGTILEVAVGRRFARPQYHDKGPLVDESEIDYAEAERALLDGLKEGGLKV